MIFETIQGNTRFTALKSAALVAAALKYINTEEEKGD